MPRVRLVWKLPILAILAVMFIVPHDPSSRVQHVGSLGVRIRSPATARRARASSRPLGERTPAPPAPGFRSTARAPQLQMLLSLLPQEPQSFQDQLVDVLNSQLSERQMRQMRVARWRAERLLRDSTTVVDAWASSSRVSLFDVDVTVDAPPMAASEANASSLAHAHAPPAYASHTSVDELRRLYGTRRRWYGDLDAIETRALYHSLLPTHLIQDDVIPLAQRARMAVSARRAARLYARERALLPVCKGSQLLDGFRQLVDHGTFQPDGLSEEQIFSKYAELHGLPPPDWYAAGEAEGEEDEAYTDFYLTVLRKSCSTNERVDELTTTLGNGLALGPGLQMVDTLRSGAVEGINSLSSLGGAAPWQL